MVVVVADAHQRNAGKDVMATDTSRTGARGEELFQFEFPLELASTIDMGS